MLEKENVLLYINPQISRAEKRRKWAMYRGKKNLKRFNFMIIEGVALIAIGAAMLLPALNSARERARSVSCVNNMKQIGTALMMYAADNDEHFPLAAGEDGLELLRKVGYITEEKVFTCPSDEDEGFNYVYVGNGLRNGEAGESVPVLLCGCHEKNNQLNVLYAVGIVRSVNLSVPVKSCREAVIKSVDTNDQSSIESIPGMKIVLKNADAFDAE